MENPIKMDDFGGTIIFGNIYMVYIIYPIIYQGLPIIDLLVPSFQGLAEVLVVMHQSLGKKKWAIKNQGFQNLFIHGTGIFTYLVRSIFGNYHWSRKNVWYMYGIFTYMKTKP